MDPAVQLRHTMRDEINNGLLGIVSEGTDYTVDLALALTSEQNHLRPLPIAGAGALQKCQGCHVRSRDRFCSCRPTCSMKSSATRLFQASKNTFDTSRSFMIKSFMSWPGQTSSRSMIQEEKRLISGCVTAEPIRRQRLFQGPGGRARRHKLTSADRPR